MDVPMVASTSRAASASMSAGTSCTPGGSLPGRCAALGCRCRRQPGQRQRLDAERQVHHLGRMPFGGDQVHHPALGEQQQGPAVAEVVGVDVRPHVRGAPRAPGRPAPARRSPRRNARRWPGWRRPAWPRGARRAITSQDPVAVTNTSPSGAAWAIGSTRKPLQRRVQGPDRIDLGHDDLGAEATGPFGHAAAAGAEPGHHHGLARQQRVGGPQDAVDDRLARCRRCCRPCA